MVKYVVVDDNFLDLAAMGGILQKMLQAFYTKKLEVVLVGLENRCVFVSHKRELAVEWNIHVV